MTIFIFIMCKRMPHPVPRRAPARFRPSLCHWASSTSPLFQKSPDGQLASILMFPANFWGHTSVSPVSEDGSAEGGPEDPQLSK